MKSIVKFLLQGLLYSVPILATIYVLYEAFIFLDGLIPFDIPGLGLLVVLFSLIIIGWTGSYVISLPIVGLVEGWFTKAPLVKVIYTSVKDLINAFVGQKKSFSKPVMMKLYENSEIRRIGFITDEELRMFETKELISVYVPHSYAFSGQLFLVPKSYVTPIQAKSTDVMKYIISGGVTEIEDDIKNIEL
jgi:uncharacterized membrane protein